MLVQSVSVALPVADLAASVRWYRKILALDEPDLEPSSGMVEFRLGGLWLQLLPGTPPGPGGGTVIRYGVPDVSAERTRLRDLGVDVGPLRRVGEILEYFDFADPDGNRLSLYAELEP
jgi:catechol 2,3-dioxygenase-like lactoylglutathione lyase family enzyme